MEHSQHRSPPSTGHPFLTWCHNRWSCQQVCRISPHSTLLQGKACIGRTCHNIQNQACCCVFHHYSKPAKEHSHNFSSLIECIEKQNPIATVIPANTEIQVPEVGDFRWLQIQFIISNKFRPLYVQCTTIFSLHSS